MGLLRKIYNFILDTAQSILLAAAVFLVIYVFLFRPFQVNGQSMYPTFFDKQYILTNLITLRFGDPKHGDVIVFKAPPDPEKDYIKRVIGESGDKVSIQNGSVYLNGQKLDESKYLKPDVITNGGAFLQEGQEITIPSNDFFVMGDNRPFSSDSREWGFVPIKNVIGKSFFVYWPLNTMELVKNPYGK